MAIGVKEQSVPKKKGVSLISDGKLSEIYSSMLQCRLIEESLQKRARRRKTSNLSWIGQVASIVGASIDLRLDDWVAPSAGDWMASFIKGLPAAFLFSQQDATTASDYRKLRIVPSSASVSTQLGNAAGIAITCQGKDSDSVVVSFIDGELSSDDGGVAAIEFAGAQALPVLFVTSAPLVARVSGKPRAKPAAALAEVHGVPVIPVDSSDVIAMYRVAHESLRKARGGGGPTLIEAKTLATGKPEDPISKMEEYLTAKGVFFERWKQKIHDSFELELDNALRSSTGTSAGRRR